MTPDEHAAMTAVRRRFEATGETFRIPKVGTQTSMDGREDVPSYADVPKSLPRPVAAAPAQPERLTLWDQPLDLWSTDR